MSDFSTNEKTYQNLPIYLNEFERNLNEFVCLRLKGNLTYTNVLSADFSYTEQQLNDQFDKIFSDSKNLSFFVKSLNLILSNNNIENFDTCLSTCSDLYERYFKKSLIKNSQTEKLVANFIPVDLLKTTTVKDSQVQNYSPLFTNHKGICQLQQYKIPIDCLILVDQNTKISALYELILEKVQLYLQTAKICYENYYQNENNFLAEPFHFIVKNNSNDLVITCIYPNNQAENLLSSLRKQIHHELGLPFDRPLLRKIDSFQFNKDFNSNNATEFSKYLLNPHLSVKQSNIKNGKQSLVKGNYLYFHYMQDNFNDNGWGCAYRSFQTIFSWFRLQSYTQKPIPTHRDIQKALVDMGDKTKDFIGSSKWIGSMEISFCLNQMLNIDCKIIYVSKGSELSEKAREMQYHFDTEGTPIMIGGGVLAHTIIGVDFDEMTGDVQFLILDPHYVGADDIKTITGKGWVGWKDMKFWNENSYYNMCCPIRPKEI